MKKQLIILLFVLAMLSCVNKELASEEKILMLESEAHHALISGNHELAETKFKEILELDPNREHVMNNLAVIYAEFIKQPEKAIELWEKLIELKPQNAAYYNNLGSMYWQKGDLENAIKTYKHALKHQKRYHMPFYNLAQIYMQKGNFEKLLEYAFEGYDRSPNDFRMVAVYSDALLLNGKRKEATEVILNALKNSPEDLNYKLRLARIYLGDGNYSAATEIIMDVLDKNPTNEMFLAEKVELMIAQNANLDVIESIIDQIKSLDYSELMPWFENYYKALLSVKHSEYESALKLLDNLEDTIPPNYLHYEGLRLNLIANILDKKHQTEKAQDLRSQAIIIAPEKVLPGNSKSPKNGGV